jgi:hypothetical protein
LLGIAVSLQAVSAGAYCRTTTCDAGDSGSNCALDANGCATKGKPLFWPSACLEFDVQKDGSPKRHISYSAFHETIRSAFREWASVDCGGGSPPSFSVWDLSHEFGPVVCDHAEFNDLSPNADVFMFRDDKWPYDDVSSTLALTTITFQVESGEILDADVEVNSFAIDLTVSSDDVHNDVQSIITHEVGHFLGLAHSKNRKATMFATYAPGSLDRSLSNDDEAGICATYPPERKVAACSAPLPAHGFSRFCGGSDTDGPPPGCSMARGSDGRTLAGMAALGLGFSLLRRRRRR